MKTNSPWVTLLKGLSVAVGIGFLLAVMLAAGPTKAPRPLSAVDAGAPRMPEYFPATKAGPVPWPQAQQQQAPSKR